MGYDFLTAIAAISYTADYKLPVMAYYNFLVGVLTPHPIVLWIAAIFFIGWSFASAILAFVILPRELLASSMDRITPSAFAKVSDHFHTPYVGNLLVVILSCVMLVLYTVYASFFATLSAVLANLICVYLPISLAAIVFPFRSATRPIFNSSAVKRKVGGVPVISVMGVLSTIVVLYIGYMFMTNPAYGANSAYSQYCCR
jgi:amino acid transporter